MLNQYLSSNLNNMGLDDLDEDKEVSSLALSTTTASMEKAHTNGMM